MFTYNNNGNGNNDYDDGGVYLLCLDEVHLAGRMGGRTYWVCDDRQVVNLDENTLEISTMVPRTT
jgi:hypothetical protein